MSYLDAIAEQYPERDGFRLIDYRLVGIPLLFAKLTLSVLEKRSLEAVREYVLRCVAVGVRGVSDISGLLGVAEPLIERTVDELRQEGYVLSPTAQAVALTARGEQIVKDAVEEITRETEVDLLWDSIRARPADRLDELLTPRDAKDRALILIPPRTRRPPERRDISIGAVQQWWAKNRPFQEEAARTEVLKVLEVKRPRFRYAEMVGLLYASEDRQEHRLLFANDDHIDVELSDAFARGDGLAKLQIPAALHGRQEAGLLKQRLTKMAKDASLQSSSRMRTDRSVLKVSLQGLTRLQQEQPSSDIQARIAEATSKMAELDRLLEQWPIHPLLPHEVPSRLTEALRCAEQEVIVTTTLPTSSRFDNEVRAALIQALRSGTTVSVYISGHLDALSVKTRLATMELNAIADSASNLRVAFLQDTGRRWFEILKDGDCLTVSNDPPLGDRPTPDAFRAFEGRSLTNHADVMSYVESYLKPDKLPCIEKAVQRRGSSLGKKRGQRGHKPNR